MSNLSERASKAVQAITQALTDVEINDTISLVLWARSSDGDSDVMFGKFRTHSICVACSLLGGHLYLGDTIANSLGHIERHRRAGHRIPDGLPDTIRKKWKDAS